MTLTATLRSASAALVAALLALHAAPAPAVAQWKPTKPIEFIVMAGVGGGADKAVRFIAKAMEDEKLLPVPINVVNKPAKSGGEALAYLKSRTGDNHTIMFTLNSYYTTPLEQPELGVDIGTFAPIGRLAEDVFLLWVHSDRKDINTIDDFVKAAKAKGSDWVMAGTGTGAEDSMLTDFLNATYGLNMTYKAFKGGGDVAKELAEKRADSTVNNPSEQNDFYPKGVTKPIVVFTGQRLTAYQKTPALRETGMDFQYFMQRSVVGAPAMSKEAEAYYQDLFKRFFAGTAWQGYRTKNSLSGEFLSGDGLRQYWLKEREKHARWKMALEILLLKSPARKKP
ncbi:MAG: tripartite tricarboxylate transporter substrate binding protein [Hyphomicrobiaceae bacterium]|nr:tripartite tricarboxylate transporter substrate binding protein [Hyphomicrobiaceae bacterium]MCC0007581.1 tripartite tricarboxylate transporter substrate binding protein [Hyphomicrobiaceae bacterium]